MDVCSRESVVPRGWIYDSLYSTSSFLFFLPDDCTSSGQFSDETGALWCTLADYYIRLGHFEKARDVYEEAIGTVVTAEDFRVVFDTYAQV